MSPEVALFGHDPMSDLSPLSGVKRKLDFGAVRAAFDPKETFKFGYETITGAIVFLEKPGPRRGR
jgi:hypothetical protein